MRIYLVETKSGGKVRASFECGDIYNIDYKILYSHTRPCYVLGEIIEIININDVNDGDCFEIWEIEQQGYDGQKYAIEIKDFRAEHMSVGEALDICNDCSIKIDCLKCPYFNNPMYLYKWDIKNNPFDEEKVTRIPQSFQYIKDPYTGEKAILLPIHKKWLDMILSGKKKYEFRNVLPKALRGAVA